MSDTQPRIQTYQPVIRQMRRSLKKLPQNGRNWLKTGRIYIKLYMSIFIRKNFSYPSKVFLSGTLYSELPKNLVICFKGTCARYCKNFPWLSTSFKFKATNFTVATRKATWIYPKPSASTQSHNLLNHQKVSKYDEHDCL